MCVKMQLDGFKAGQQATQAQQRLSAEQQRDGVKMGIDIAKSRQPAQRPKGAK